MAKAKTKTTHKNKKRVTKKATKKTKEFPFFTRVVNGAKKLLSAV